MMGGYGWDNGGMGWGAWIFMGFMMLVFFAVIAAVVIAVVRTSGHGPGAAPGSERSANDALRVLDERFARGDIDDDEYTKRRDLLRSR